MVNLVFLKDDTDSCLCINQKILIVVLCQSDPILEYECKTYKMKT